MPRAALPELPDFEALSGVPRKGKGTFEGFGKAARGHGAHLVGHVGLLNVALVLGHGVVRVVRCGGFGVGWTGFSVLPVPRAQ